MSTAKCPVIPDILGLLAATETRAAPPITRRQAQLRKRKAPITPFLTWTRLSGPHPRRSTEIPPPLAVNLQRQRPEDAVVFAPPPPSTAEPAAPEPTPALHYAAAADDSSVQGDAAPALDPLDRVELDLTAPVVRKNLKIMVPNPDISEFYVLPSGDEVGKFSVKYLLYLDQKSMCKRKRQKQQQQK